ncbi:hypothetical protein [Microbulbifer sp. JMSA008]|uniref:hypothetical protein n=1 Tax=Microbulbifer sp. JMSA008 TaxID=3243373 RepID=UPI00403972FE
MKSIYRILFLGFFFLSVYASAAEGPFYSDGTPWVRVSSNGDFVIYRMPSSAGCYGDKISVGKLEDPDMRKMTLSLVTAAQMSERRVKVWVNYVGSTAPQRCTLAFIEVE